MPRTGQEAITAPRFSAGNTTSVELRKRNVLAGLLVVLQFDWLVTGGTGAGAIFADGMYRLIRRVELIANGKTVQSYSGQFLRLLGKVFNAGIEFTQTPPTLLTAAASELARKAYFRLPFDMMYSFTPEEFGLPTSLLDAPTLAITWGDGEDVASGTDATSIALNNADVKLYELPYVDPDRPPAAHQALEIKSVEKDVSQSGDITIEMPHLKPGHELRAIFVEAFGGGVSGRDFIYNNSVITSLRLMVNGRPVRERSLLVDVQQLNRLDYGITGAMDAGVVVLDSATDQKTSKGDLWTIASDDTPALELVVAKQSGENKVRVTTIFCRR